MKFGPKATNRCRKLQPDGSLVAGDAKFPFLILEVANSQTKKAVDKKIWYWVQGSKQHVKILCVFDIVAGPTGHQVFVDIVKPKAIPSPGPGDTTNFRVEAEYIVKREEIFPNVTKKYFSIYFTEVIPNHWADDPTASVKRAIVRLSAFAHSAKQAAQTADIKAREQAAPGNSSPFNPEQEALSSPVSSIQWEPEDETVADSLPEEDDSTYEEDSSESEEPSYKPQNSRYQ